MPFDSGLKIFQKNTGLPLISTGDSSLDELLSGGLHRDLIYLLYGDKKRTTNVLLTTAVNVQKSFNRGGIGEGIKVAFIDSNNRFNPYNISKYAVSQNLSPRKVLENIIVARAFTWDQMVELLENRLATLEHVKVVLISGVTNLIQNHEKKTFEDLLRSISGIKKILEKANPLIILTAPLNDYSSFRPKGGKILSHFGSVLAMINEKDRYFEYILVQHPYLPENRIVKWKPQKLEQRFQILQKIENWIAGFKMKFHIFLSVSV